MISFIKKTQLLVSIIIISLMILSCKNSTENLSDENFNIVKIKNDYTIKVPKYMEEADLNEEASLEYQNISEEEESYAIIIDESKNEFVTTYKELKTYNNTLSVIENYRDVHLQILETNITLQKRSESKSLKINDLNAEQVEIDGKFEDIDIAYFLTFIEGNEKVYMIMSWTLENRKDKYRSTFNKMAESFKIIKNKFGKREQPKEEEKDVISE